MDNSSFGLGEQFKVVVPFVGSSKVGDELMSDDHGKRD